jgi:hypothetical protein
MGRFVSEAYLDGALAQMDGDGSGEVDYEEFEAWWDQEAATREDVEKAADYAFQPSVDTDPDFGRGIFDRAKALRADGQWAAAVAEFARYRHVLTGAAGAAGGSVPPPPRPAGAYGLLRHQLPPGAVPAVAAPAAGALDERSDLAVAARARPVSCGLAPWSFSGDHC